MFRGHPGLTRKERGMKEQGIQDYLYKVIDDSIYNAESKIIKSMAVDTNMKRAFKEVYMEDYDLKTQIRMIYSYNNILMACGSGYTHIAFMRDNSNYIELCPEGFRYPNPLIFGNIYNVNSKLLMLPLNNIMSQYRNLNAHTKKLFNIIDNSPNISYNKMLTVNNLLSKLRKQIDSPKLKDEILLLLNSVNDIEEPVKRLLGADALKIMEKIF